MQIDHLFQFFELLNALQLVRRTIYVKGEDRLENDVEHQYQLAMVAWYIIAAEGLPLNLDRAVRYALVHDMVEVYAGDTWFYKPDAADKSAREHAAALRLQKEFPQFAQMHELIAAYERCEDPESRFVYALDKLVPVINIYLDGGRTWKQHGVTCAMLVENKAEKISISPEVKKMFDELVPRLRQAEPDLFSPAHKSPVV